MAVQLSAQSEQQIRALLERYPTRRAVMLPALHLVAREFPYIDDAVCQAVADLQVPMVDVKGVATFYTMFPTAPRGKYLLQLCINLPCSLGGRGACCAFWRARWGLRLGSDPDGRAPCAAWNARQPVTRHR